MINSRALIITFSVIIAFIYLVLILFSIQITNHSKYDEIANNQQYKTVDLLAERGTIKDCNGEVLVFTKDDVSFYVDTRMNLNDWKKDTIASKFSRVFNKSKQYYRLLLNNRNKIICLEKKAPKEKALKLENFIIDELIREDDHTRIYPYGKIASHILGYISRKRDGVTGIEKIYDENLKGEPGISYVEKDVIGRIVTVDDNLSQPAIPGETVHLTINKKYQRILEEELAAGLLKFQAESGVGILMNPRSGEILSLVNLPDYNPNKYHLFSDYERKNRALTDTYEPGSTMKSIAMSMLIEKNLIRDTEIINTENGKYRVHGTYIRDTHKFEKLTVREVLEQSSNIGMAKLSDRIDSETFYKYLRDFGFGNPTSIELSGEVSGKLKKPDSYSKISKNFMSYGYEIAVTPIQLIAAYSALINGGYLLQPYVVNKITDHRGEVIEENSPKLIRRVITKSTSVKIKDYMIGVVENGTGDTAQLENVLVGGKTGTSQRLVDGKYSRKEYNASFIGFLPADNPQLICLILVESPKSGKYGGEVAAPIFKEVAAKLIDADLDLAPNRKSIKREGNNFSKIFTDLKRIGNQLRSSNLNEIKNSNKKINRLELTNKKIMPDLKNYSMREAIALLTNIGIDCDIIGSGRVVWQSIKPGTKIKSGMECTLKCDTTKKMNSININ